MSSSVTILGEVKRGGLYSTSIASSLRQLVELAGPTRSNDLAIIYRAAQSSDSVQEIRVSLASLLDGTIDDVPLLSRDRVFVGDPAGGRGVVYLDGSVKRPGVYQLPEGGRLTVGKLITSAGSQVEGDASPVAIRVIRIGLLADVSPLEREFRVSIPEASSFRLQPDDHVFVAKLEGTRGAAGADHSGH